MFWHAYIVYHVMTVEGGLSWLTVLAGEADLR